jgi:hypothetical protein
VLPAVSSKDAGATPAIIAWVLSEILIPDRVCLPGGIEPAALRAIATRSLRGLRRAAVPPAKPD